MEPENKKKVLVMGYGEGVINTIKTFKKNKDIIELVVLPDNRPGESIKKTEEFCNSEKIKTVIPKNPNKKEFIELLKIKELDFIVVNAYSRILKNELISLPRYGCINIHGAPLPNYRGANVLNWQIINGEKKSGVTIHYINEEIDSGDTIGMSKFEILFEDTAVNVYEKMIESSSNLFDELWPKIKTGQAERKAQFEQEARYFRKRTPEDGCIDWKKPAEEIYNLIRALVEPWPGAFYVINDKKIIINKYLPLNEVIAMKER